MKTLDVKSEKEAEAKVIELTKNGVHFCVTGRTQIIVFE